jgi:hypothetical protein
VKIRRDSGSSVRIREVTSGFGKIRMEPGLSAETGSGKRGMNGRTEKNRNERKKTYNNMINLVIPEKNGNHLGKKTQRNWKKRKRSEEREGHVRKGGAACGPGPGHGTAT